MHPHRDFLPLNGTEHVEFYVGNARQASLLLSHGLRDGPDCLCGPETQVRDRASYVLQQGKIRFVLTTPLRPGGEFWTIFIAMAMVCGMWRYGWMMRSSRGASKSFGKGNFKALFEAIERERRSAATSRLGCGVD